MDFVVGDSNKLLQLGTVLRRDSMIILVSYYGGFGWIGGKNIMVTLSVAWIKLEWHLEFVCWRGT